MDNDAAWDEWNKKSAQSLAAESDLKEEDWDKAN